MRAAARLTPSKASAFLDADSFLDAPDEGGTPPGLIEKGNIEEGFAAADLVVEGEYRTGHQEQLYIEPNGVIAVPDGDSGGITVYGSMQCPYYVHRALTVLLDLRDEQVRVIQTETGGGFGGKEEYPSMIAGHAALAASLERQADVSRPRPARRRVFPDAGGHARGAQEGRRDLCR